MSIAEQTQPMGNAEDTQYAAYVESLTARAHALAAQHTHAFRVSADGLWHAYLNAFKGDAWQYHNCHACHRFIEQHGSMVVIDTEGVLHSVWWHEDDAPDDLKAAVLAMRMRVESGRVESVVGDCQQIAGTAVTGPWRHMAARIPAQWATGKKPHVTAANVATVRTALLETDGSSLRTAVALLQSGQIRNAGGIQQQAEWLLGVYNVVGQRRQHEPHNRLWRAVAAAPDGFCHPRSGVLGTLLDMLKAGRTGDAVVRTANEMLAPLNYQRPQAPPSEGTIDQAEKLMAEMGAASALRRRHAHLEEIEAVWRQPSAALKTPDAGIFGALRTAKTATPTVVTPGETAISFTRFMRDVLTSDVERIEVWAPTVGHYGALMTAVDPDALPIIRWDGYGSRRNPFTWYVYPKGANALVFGLNAGWQPVDAVTLTPNQWHGRDFEGEHKGAFFVIRGAVDGHLGGGSALFPALLRSEFHGVRAVIEAYSKATEPEGDRAQMVAGLMYMPGNATRVRVLRHGVLATFSITLWD